MISVDTSLEAREKALAEGKYGRCVFHCDNKVVDRQVVNMLYEDGVTVSFTLNGFNSVGFRETRIFGTKGDILANFGEEFIRLIKAYVEEKDIIRPQDMVVKSVANKSGNKIFIIQSIDRKMDFEDIARAKNLDFEELLSDIEGIVNSGTRLDISYYLDQYMDQDKIEDIYLYFKEDAESDSLEDAIEELGSDYSEEEIRLVRIKFLCEVGN